MTSIGKANIALGAYIRDAPWNASKIDDFTKLVGRMPSVVMWYQDWAHSSFNATVTSYVTARGATPVLTWEPWDYTGGKVQPAYALQRILAGVHDTYIRLWAQDAARWAQPLYLRFAHEMNGNWYPWSPGVNGNSDAAQYVAVWKRVVDIFRKEKATNVRWIWSPNVAFPGSTPMKALYPGDAYVDWIGLDGYNWGTAKVSNKWQSVAEVFTASYKEITAITAKPLMIAETASSEVGGSKADWITSGFMTGFPTLFPRVQAILWFNEPKEEDWPVNSSFESLEAFKKMVAATRYQGVLA